MKPRALVLLIEGLLLEKRGRWPAAARRYRAIVDRGVELPRIYFRLGSTEEQQGRFEAAVEAYAVAAAADGSVPYWYYRLGYAQEKLGLWAAAGASYRIAVDLDERVPEWQFRLAHAYERTGHLHIAADTYRVALAHDDSQPRWHYRLGRVLEKTGAFEEATEAYRAAIRGDDADSGWHYRLGRTLEKRKDWSGAVAAYEQVIVRDDRDPRPHYHLGKVHEERRHWLAAVEAYRRAAVLDDTDPAWFYRLGHALEKIGAWGTARYVYSYADRKAGSHGLSSPPLSYRKRLDFALCDEPAHAYWLNRVCELASDSGVSRVRVLTINLSERLSEGRGETHRREIEERTGVEVSLFRIQVAHGTASPHLGVRGSHLEPAQDQSEALVAIRQLETTVRTMLRDADAPIAGVNFGTASFELVRNVLTAMGDGVPDRWLLPRLTLIVSRTAEDPGFSEALWAFEAFNRENVRCRVLPDEHLRSLPLELPWHHGVSVLHRQADSSTDVVRSTHETQSPSADPRPSDAVAQRRMKEIRERVRHGDVEAASGLVSAAIEVFPDHIGLLDQSVAVHDRAGHHGLALQHAMRSAQIRLDELSAHAPAPGPPPLNPPHNIVISGYFYSGSGCVLEYLMAFEGIYKWAPVGEMRLVKSPGGLGDMFSQYSENDSLTSEAIVDFYLHLIGAKLVTSPRARYSHRRVLNRNSRKLLEHPVARGYVRECLRMFRGLERFHSAREHDDETFASYLRGGLEKALKAIADATDADVLLLDQAVNAWRLPLARLIPPATFIIVHRDPRDQFAEVREARKRTGRKPVTVERFAEKYRTRRRAVRELIPELSSRYGHRFMEVGFEDFVTDHASQARGLRNELGIANRPYRSDRFDISRSMRNVGKHRYLLPRTEREHLGGELEEYLHPAADQLMDPLGLSS